MNRIKIHPHTLNGEVIIPGSKSYTHRAIVLASLAKGTSIIYNPLLSRDTYATINGCKSFGVSIQIEKHLTVEGNILKVPDNIINVENSGTTIRFLTPLSSLIPKGYVILTGDDSIRSRPMQPLITALLDLGVECYSTRQNGLPPIIIKGGGLKGGKSIKIVGEISSQFISALLLVSPKSEKNIEIRVSGEIVSKPYVDATLTMMDLFGSHVDRENYDKYMIPARQEYKCTDVNIPGDFSSASIILAAAILSNGTIKVQGLNFLFPQADSMIINILKKMGVYFEINSEQGYVIIDKNQRLNGGEFNLSDCPDLLPVVAILALKTNSKVIIKGVKHARYKETDRIKILVKELSKTGASITELDDGLIINGTGKIKGCYLDPHNDHRLFMAFCALACGALTPCVIDGIESVDVSYPNFIGDLKSLDANIESQ